VGADAWLSRNKQMKAMRRFGHAAAAGRAMEMSAGAGEVARGQAIAAGARRRRRARVDRARPDRRGGQGGARAARWDPRQATVLGRLLLSEASEVLIGGAEAIAAGAVLAVISISIVPYAFSEVSSLVATATVLGFVGGYLLS
jgi:hypothetical protein